MAFKETKRKGFNFFRSYYDVYNELSDKDKVQFMDALLDRQFLGIKPEGLTGMAKFAYISQTNSIDSQVKGYEHKTKTKLNNQGGCISPCQGGSAGGVDTPAQQVEEKEEDKEEYIIAENWIYSNFELKHFNWYNIKPIEKQLQNEFIEHWNEEKKRVKGKSHLKQLPEAQTELYLQIRSKHTKQDVINALKALFQQKEIYAESQHLDPRHFLNNFNKWYSAFNEGNKEVYLKKDKVNRL